MVFNSPNPSLFVLKRRTDRKNKAKKSLPPSQGEWRIITIPWDSVELLLCFILDLKSDQNQKIFRGKFQGFLWYILVLCKSTSHFLYFLHLQIDYLKNLWTECSITVGANVNVPYMYNNFLTVPVHFNRLILCCGPSCNCRHWLVIL